MSRDEREVSTRNLGSPPPAVATGRMVAVLRSYSEHSIEHQAYRYDLKWSRRWMLLAADRVEQLAAEVERRRLAWEMLGTVIGNSDLMLDQGAESLASHIDYLRNMLKALTRDIAGEGPND